MLPSSDFSITYLEGAPSDQRRLSASLKEKAKTDHQAISISHSHGIVAGLFYQAPNTTSIRMGVDLEPQGRILSSQAAARILKWPTTGRDTLPSQSLASMALYEWVIREACYKADPDSNQAEIHIGLYHIDHRTQIARREDLVFYYEVSTLHQSGRSWWVSIAQNSGAQNSRSLKSADLS